MRRLIIVSLLFSMLIFAGCSDDQAPNSGSLTNQTTNIESQLEDSYPVIRVVDGDTIIVDIDGAEERIRMIGIDTPESVHPDESKNIEYGKIASDFTKEQLENKAVALEYDVQERDKYGRILAYVYLDGKMYNKTLLEEGHAKVATYPPNVKYVDEFTALQEQARENKKGIWAYDAFEGSAPDAASTNNKQEGSSKNSSSVQTEASYVGNSNTMKFHRPDCKYAVQIADHNLVHLKTRDDAMNGGYAGCKVCNP